MLSKLFFYTKVGGRGSSMLAHNHSTLSYLSERCTEQKASDIGTMVALYTLDAPNSAHGSFDLEIYTDVP